uniref:Nucleosome assembly protein 1-like 1 n=1 Tax=Steinernema glaseri TaxID=37863 RepID=A0A1I8ATZ9_9BILA
DGKVDVEQTHFRTSDKTVYIECSPNCACRGKCKRKTFIQDAIQYRVELIMTKNRGFTCHVREPIPVGSYVCEFTGRVYKNSEDKEHNPLDSYSYTVSDMSGDENVTIVIDPFHHVAIMCVSHSRNCLEMSEPQEVLEFSADLQRTTARTRQTVRALKKLQLSTIKLEEEYYRRLHELDVEFQRRFNKLQEQRCAFVTGAKEPTDKDADIPLLHNADKEGLQKLEQAWDKENPDDGVRGVPKFWLLTLLHCETTAAMITPADKDVLAYLNDITCVVESNPPSFTLRFQFGLNEFFTNTVLEKRYVLSENADPENPFDYEGLSIFDCGATHIEWKEGRNVTKKVVEKKMRNSSTGEVKTTLKSVKTDSFFNFFDPPNPAHFADNDKAVYEALMSDFEIGLQIREEVIPRAVLFYTGEIADCQYDDCEIYEEEEEEEGDEEGNSEEN